jgi:hypothetical protein
MYVYEIFIFAILYYINVVTNSREEKYKTSLVHMKKKNMSFYSYFKVHRYIEM